MLSVDDQIVLALRRINQAIDLWLCHLWQDYGLTAPQLATLREIQAGRERLAGNLGRLRCTSANRRSPASWGVSNGEGLSAGSVQRRIVEATLQSSRTKGGSWRRTRHRSCEIVAAMSWQKYRPGNRLKSSRSSSVWPR